MFILSLAEEQINVVPLRLIISVPLLVLTNKHCRIENHKESSYTKNCPRDTFVQTIVFKIKHGQWNMVDIVSRYLCGWCGLATSIYEVIFKFRSREANKNAHELTRVCFLNRSLYNWDNEPHSFCVEQSCKPCNYCWWLIKLKRESCCLKKNNSIQNQVGHTYKRDKHASAT
jgi:hypothetical protein